MGPFASYLLSRTDLRIVGEPPYVPAGIEVPPTATGTDMGSASGSAVVSPSRDLTSPCEPPCVHYAALQRAENENESLRAQLAYAQGESLNGHTVWGVEW